MSFNNVHGQNSKAVNMKMWYAHFTTGARYSKLLMDSLPYI